MLAWAEKRMVAKGGVGSDLDAYATLTDAHSLKLLSQARAVLGRFSFTSSRRSS